MLWMMNSKVFEIGKWVLIVVLGLLIAYLLKSNHDLSYSYEAYKKDGTYMRTYDNQTISELKKTNKELYDSVKNKKDVKQGIIIKYKYIYNGDTIHLPIKLDPIPDSIYLSRNGKLKLLNDTTYAFNGGNKDGVSYVLNINTKVKPNWYKINFKVDDKLTLINREQNGKNELSITTNGGIIDGTSVFNKTDNKNSFLNRFSISVQVGAGYGLITNNPDIFVGFGISYRLNKLK